MAVVNVVCVKYKQLECVVNNRKADTGVKDTSVVTETRAFSLNVVITETDPAHINASLI